MSTKADPKAQKHMLSQKPDIIVSTPAKILTHLNQKNIHLKESLETLIIDEADLMFSFGFENDLKSVFEHLPPTYQVNKFYIFNFQF